MTASFGTANAATTPTRKSAASAGARPIAIAAFFTMLFMRRRREAQIGKALGLGEMLRLRVENGADRESRQAAKPDRRRDDQGRKARHEARPDEFDDDRNDQNRRDADAENAEEAVNETRAVQAQEAEHPPQNSRAVAQRAELARGAFLARAVRRLDFRHRNAQQRRMRRHLDFDFKAARAGGKALDEAPRQHAIAAQNVGVIGPEERAKNAGEKAVAEHMPRPVGGGR